MPVRRNCPICDKDDPFVLVRGSKGEVPLRVVICRSCGLVFVNPAYTGEEKQALSDSARALHRSGMAAKSIDRAHEHASRRARRFLEFARQYLHAGQEALEIGCGDGALVPLLCEAGLKPMGVDLDPQGARFIEEKFGVRVVVGPFEEAGFPDECFDLVAGVHIIEHVFEPVDVLRKVHRLLRPGGLVLLETPNILRPKVGFGRMFSLPHNYYFSPRTLCLALDRAGLAVVAVREFNRDSFLVAARKAPGRRAAPAVAGDCWQEVARRILGHDLRYKVSLQFLWRKIPGLKDVLMYRVHRDRSGDDLTRWLAGAKPQASCQIPKSLNP